MPWQPSGQVFLILQRVFLERLFHLPRHPLSLALRLQFPLVVLLVAISTMDDMYLEHSGHNHRHRLVEDDSENGLIELIVDPGFGYSVSSSRFCYSLYLYSAPSTLYFLSYYVVSLFDNKHSVRVQQFTAA